VTATLSRTGSVCGDIAICGNAVVITVESICCMMIADATIMARTFGFVWATYSAIKASVPPEHSPKDAAGEAALYLAGGELFFQALDGAVRFGARRTGRGSGM
jgi:hypothetical protein